MDNDGAKQRTHQTAFKAALCLAAVLLIFPSLSLAQLAPGTDTVSPDPAAPQDSGAQVAAPSASVTPPPPPPPGGGITISQTLSDEGQRNIDVEAHGGSIFVESEPDRGTTFTVRLPVHSEGANGTRSMP